MRVKNRLHELTKDLYLKYKKNGFSDVQIQRLFNCGTNTLVNWKRENGIPKRVTLTSFEGMEILMPEEIEKLKIKFLKYEKMGWTLPHIGEKLGMGEVKVNRFKTRYFPEKKNKKRRYYSKEELEIIKKNGLTAKVVNNRRTMGWTLEEAMNIPRNHTREGIRKYDVMWNSRKRKEG